LRKALSIGKLKSVYGRIAKQYDLQHSLITAGTDQKGRKLLVDKAIGESLKYYFFIIFIRPEPQMSIRRFTDI
jgi:hypothetical protein